MTFSKQLTAGADSSATSDKPILQGTLLFTFHESVCFLVKGCNQAPSPQKTSRAFQPQLLTGCKHAILFLFCAKLSVCSFLCMISSRVFLFFQLMKRSAEKCSERGNECSEQVRELYVVQSLWAKRVPHTCVFRTKDCHKFQTYISSNQSR